MRQFRKLIFWAHLMIGVLAGAIILVLCVTGTLLAFEEPITTWMDGYKIQAETYGTPRLPLDSLVAKAQETEPNATPSVISMRAVASLPISITFGREKTVFLDPYTGQNLGEGAKQTRALFRSLTDWHRWLGRPETSKPAGRAITGASNLAFLFLVMSGIWLWWPRNWNWPSFKAVTFLNRQARGKARDWNWHNVFGFWCSLPLFFIVLTGVIMSYPWANNLLFRLTGNEPPPARSENAPTESKGKEHKPNPGATPRIQGLDKAFAQVDQKFSGWKSIRARLTRGGNGVTFMVDQGNGRPDKRSQMTFDLKTGDATSTETFASYNAGRKLRTMARFIHTGQAGGLPGQAIAAAATAGGAMLVWTGFAMAFRRFFARFFARSNSSANPASTTKAV